MRVRSLWLAPMQAAQLQHHEKQKNDPDRLEMNKYCRFCKKHTVHKETR